MSPMSRVLPTVSLPFAVSVLACLLALLDLTTGSISRGVAPIALANGVLIALLLRQPASRWPMLLGASMVGLLASAVIAGASLPPSLILVGASMLQILLVAAPFARHFGPRSGFGSPGHLLRLGALAAFASLAAAPPAALSLALRGQPFALEPLVQTLVAGLLGTVIVTPLVLCLTSSRRSLEPGRGTDFALLSGLTLLVAFWVFSRDTSSIFLVTPVLVLAGLRLRLQQATALVALVCFVGFGMTILGLGPLNAPSLDFGDRTFLLQAFMASVVTLVLPVAALGQERGRTAAALRRSEEHYRLLADHGSDIVLRLDRGGEARFVSSAARRLLGVSESALAGPALRERIHPEDLPRFDFALERSRLSGHGVTCFRMRHARGDYRWIEAHFRVAGQGTTAVPTASQQSCAAAAEGRCTPGAKAPCLARPTLAKAPPCTPPLARQPVSAEPDIVATLRDIDQRRRAELLAAQSAVRLRESNRLLLMAEGLASLGHWVYDPSARGVLLSAEAAILLDLRQLTMTPRQALDLVLAEDRQRLLRQLALARRFDAPAECTVRIGRGADPRTLQLRIQQKSAEEGDIALFGVISDITEKLQAERKLVAALEEARSAARFRSQFLATMSHEIRTPMTGVIGMIELLEGDPGPADRQLYVDTLRQSAKLLMAVVDDILDFSKVDAGHLTFADEPFDVGQLLLSTQRLFKQAASSRGLSLTLDGPPPASLWVRGDALRLQQVLSNLLSNAIKFSEGGQVSLRCSVRPRPGGKQAIRLTVEDQGKGIPPTVQAQLFEPFVQGDMPPGRGGTGLGLAIAHRLVAGMGGHIAVCSDEGRGSTFAINLVLAEVPAPAIERSRSVQAPARPLDILLAEDNVVNQLLITALLKRLGHRVTCAADGEAALACANDRRFDLVLLDMQMPRRDGLSTATAIRSGGGVNAATAILALTADAAAERRSFYEEGGIDAVLTKPIDSAALASALMHWSAGSRAGRQGEGDGEGAASCLNGRTLAEIGSIVGESGLDDLLDLLALELDARPRAIRDALADQHLSRAAGEAHSLKGAAANLGAHSVAQAAERLEQAIAKAKQGDRASLAPALRRLAGAVSDTHHALSLLPRRRLPVALGGR